MKKIVLAPVGGLGNRMRSIDSALGLSEELGCKLKVIWRVNNEVGAGYYRLFLPDPRFKVTDLYVNSLYDRISAGLVFRINRSLKRVYWDSCNFLDFANDPEGAIRRSFNSCVHISTSSRFHPRRGMFDFKPSVEICSKVSQVFKCIRSNVIGVHIRRGDNIESIQRSPIKAFQTRIHAELENDSSVVVFLATDDKEVEFSLKNMFKERVITYRKTAWDRRSNEGAIDAAVELFCLAKCNKILGSYYSSYSAAAAEIGMVTLDVVDISK